jgi:hypothetical protein
MWRWVMSEAGLGATDRTSEAVSSKQLCVDVTCHLPTL